MSDQPQGEGWWQASDGKWYPPSQAPQAPPTSQPPPPVPGSAYAPPAPPTGPTPPGMIPPQPGMAYPAGAYTGPPQQQGMSGCAKAAIVIGVLLFLGMAGCGVAVLVFGDEAVDRIEEGIDDARLNGREDVSIESCELDADGFMTAELEVTNNSSGRSQYAVIVGFRADDGSEPVAGAPTGVGGVEPGETVRLSVRSSTTTTEELDCRLIEAFRTADE